MTAGGTVTGRAERRAERERERHVRSLASEARLAEHAGTIGPLTNAVRSVVSILGVNANDPLNTPNAPTSPAIGDRDDDPQAERLARALDDDTSDDMIIG